MLDPGAGKTKTGYLWALTRDDRGWNGADPPAVVFTYAPPFRRMLAFACQATGRSGSHAMDILKDFNGILQVDGYAGYDALAEPRRIGGTPLTLAYCWAHARRKRHDITQKDGSGIAAEGLRRIARIYKIVDVGSCSEAVDTSVPAEDAATMSTDYARCVRCLVPMSFSHSHVVYRQLSIYLLMLGHVVKLLAHLSLPRTLRR